MKIPFLDFISPYAELRQELDTAYFRVMQSAWYVLGKEVEAFEAEFGAFCRVKYCVGVGNGLEALHLIFRAWEIGPGDEVIVPSNTYIASWLAVSMAGAKPIPVEPDPLTYNLDPNKVEAAITPATRAIMAVHLYGQSVEMPPLMRIAERHGLKVVEDNAQAQGACCLGAVTGGLGHAAGHSFYPSKNLGAVGDAGAITTNDAELAKRVCILRNYGSKVRYHNEVKGFNSRLDELQAAFLRVKLKRLNEWNERRRQTAGFYLRALESTPEIILPTVPAWSQPAWHLFVIRHPRRNDLQKFLTAAGVETLIHYPVPPHLSPAYADAGYKAGDFPIAEELANTVLSLPVGPHLTESQAAAVVAALNGAI